MSDILEVSDDELADFAEEMIAEAIRDLIHERMGQCEQLGDKFEGFGDLTEDEQDAVCERLEAVLQRYLDALLEGEPESEAPQAGETDYLLSSLPNTKRLLGAVERLEGNGEVVS